MRQDTKVQVMAAAMMIVCLVASGVLAMQITGSSARHKLVYSVKAEEGDPPQVALGIAMGAFRGLFVNFLWIRANEMKDEGRYYEAIDLASTITKLQPRFPRVWAFHAWNMAYNISVTTQTLGERWQWVQAGINLLRNEGIPANPNEMLLHKELAWIFLHKVAGWTDDANQYYKAQLAGEWTIVLGEPPRPSPSIAGDRDAVIELFAEWLEHIASAPSTLDEVIKQEPSVRTLVDRLASEAGVEPGFDLLRRYERQRVIEERGGASLLGEIRYSERGEAFKNLYLDPTLAKAWDALLPHVRKRLLVDSYNMEPERMVRYTRTYGPIDWRWPSAHALYWSVRGVERGLLRSYEGNVRDFDFLNTDRVVMQSVQDLYRYSQIYFDFYTWITQPANPAPTMVYGPNINFIPTYGQILQGIVDRGGIFEDPTKRIYTSVGLGYENFMRDAIRHYWRAGFKQKAEEMRDALAVWEGQNANDSDRAEEFSLPMAEFINKDLKDRTGSPNVAVSEIVGALQAAYNFGLLAGDNDRFRAEFDYASKFHALYMNEQYRNVVAQGGAEFRMGMVKKNFRLMAGTIFAEFLSVISVEDAQTVYGNAPDDLKRWAYDDLVQLYKQAMDADPNTPTFEQVFPEPEGMEAFRVERQQIEAREQERRGPQGLESQ